jgi:hypothetical protein
VTRAPKRTRPVVETASSAADADAAEIVQVKVWLLGISPMVWRRVLVPSTCTLRELHGVIQVAMGWEGIHLYQFCLRAARYGSSELSASSPEVALAALRLRTGARFAYEYDLNSPWRHEVRIEDHLSAEPGKAHPRCIGGNGTCPPEDGGGPAGFMAERNAMLSLDALEDREIMAEIIGQVVQERRTDLLDDEGTCWRLEQAVERSKAREQAQGRPFSRRTVNARFRNGEHLDLMHQQD